ncbi:MAG: amidohydrolase family protein [Brevibacterium sp.]|uniref:amidohydrolase family protein n=1 Tax=Brevibacterium sp. TaxID=1701 RepID=UPI002647F049|nr:amidohydrolase family protein [Brevibacterium sp.]MDN5806614.1 amidohydrolase family protein [Brevibacterium sp.]MDN5833708.1 amidohydrolase family protein [Brevibacterium sp.]MDN5875973.1 amidohydrolase family protein [Brevibacterium sp.]MDN5910105.1 amidohydrolase family protein [Brevibacterium sp.]MDN6124713.1 amidohydrolase family protein [Brevibacterium sp.]
MTILRNVRLFPRTADTAAVDVEIEDGRFSSFTSHTPGTTSAGAIEGAGRALLPSLGDVHAHLDSNRSGQTFRPHTADGTLHGLIMNDRENWRAGERSVRDQADFVIATIIASGGTRIRSHTQIDADCGLERFSGVRDALAAHAEVLDSQIVAFPQAGIVREKGVRDLLDAALNEGADLVGGLDPLQYDRDPVAHLDVVFGLAEKHGKGVDIHLHERGSAGVFTIEEIAHRTKALGMQGQVTISHAFALSSNPEPEVERIVDILAEAGISLTTVAPHNGVLPQRSLREKRVALALGEDGQRDYWSPYGDGDLLRRTWQLAFTNGHRRDEDIEACLDIASRGGAQVMAGARPEGTALVDDARFGLGIGAPADFMLVTADTVTSAIMDCPADRDVYKGGRLVATGGRLVGGKH